MYQLLHSTFLIFLIVLKLLPINYRILCDNAFVGLTVIKISFQILLLVKEYNYSKNDSRWF